MASVIPTPTPLHLPHAPQPKRWTVAEYHAIRGEPWLENRWIILVEGEILEMPAPNPRHNASVGLTENALRTVWGGGFWIRTQMPLVLGLSTDPVPDVAVVVGSPRDYVNVQPRTASLVVEISDSTLAYDTREKANLYAASGIADYWVVDLVHRVLIVFRDPVADPVQLFGAVYRSQLSLDSSAAVHPLHLAGMQVQVADLLP